MILSVVIPSYNEEKTLPALIERIAKLPLKEHGFDLELIVVDDCSKDRTPEILHDLSTRFPGLRALRNETNRGKGASVRKGVEVSQGDVVLVQDADLEYEPEDYPALLDAWKKLANQFGSERAVVYGSRWKGQLQKGWSLFPGKHPRQGIGPWGANLLLSTLSWSLTGRWFTDLLTAYKLYPGAVLRSIPVKTRGFETDHELTMRLIRRGCRFREIGIHYHPRSKEEGKKIRAVDFVHAVKTLIRFRFSD